ncbi:MAG: hypothetical protein ABIF10_00100 [Candidatus Woesearchaeota archaeon]
MQHLLKVAGCDVFDYVLGQQVDEMPDKLLLLERFIKEFQKPLCYVGNSLEDMQSCKRLAIPSILVTYDSHEKAPADHVASSVNDLDLALKNLLI